MADSARYLKKNRKMVGHLMTPGLVRPGRAPRGAGADLADPAADVQRLHVFTFNQVGATVAWQQRMLAELDEVA